MLLRTTISMSVLAKQMIHSHVRQHQTLWVVEGVRKWLWKTSAVKKRVAETALLCALLDLIGGNSERGVLFAFLPVQKVTFSSHSKATKGTPTLRFLTPLFYHHPS